MNARDFFYLAAQTRAAQKAYFANRDPNVFRACRRLENQLDAEIKRVQDILNDNWTAIQD